MCACECLFLFLDKGILNNISASISKWYIRPLLQTLRDKQEANYKPQSLLLNCHPFRAKMSIAVTSKARHASAIKPLSSFCKITHVLGKLWRYTGKGLNQKMRLLQAGNTEMNSLNLEAERWNISTERSVVIWQKWQVSPSIYSAFWTNMSTALFSPCYRTRHPLTFRRQSTIHVFHEDCSSLFSLQNAKKMHKKLFNSLLQPRQQ